MFYNDYGMLCESIQGIAMRLAECYSAVQYWKAVRYYYGQFI